MKLLFFFTLLSALIHAIPERAAALDFPIIGKREIPMARSSGEILLNSFSCKGYGGPATQRVQESLNRLQKDVVEAIGKKEGECGDEVAMIASLPKVEAIVANLEASETQMEVRRLQSEINQAKTDILARKRLPPNHPDLPYMPTPQVLVEVINTRQFELDKLLVKLKLEEVKQRNEKYKQGIGQMEELASKLNLYLKTSKSECLKKNPSVREHILASLTGIAGFFMATPYGMAAMAAGRIMQGVFSYFDARKETANTAFADADRLNMVRGLGCTMQNLSDQQCKIYREREALREILDPESGKNSAIPGDVHKANQGEQKAARSLKRMEGWGEDSRNELSSDPTHSRIRSALRIAVRNSYDTFESEISEYEKLLESTKSIAKPGSRGPKIESLKPIVKNYSNCIIYGKCAKETAEQGAAGQAAAAQNDAAKFLSTDDEKKYGPLNLLYDKADIANIVEIFNKYRANKPDAPWLYHETDSKAEVWQWFDWVFSGGPGVPEMERYFAKLSDDKLLSDVKRRARLRMEEAQTLTAVTPSEEAIGWQLNQFFQRSATDISPYQALQSLNEYLDALDPDYIKEKDSFLDISDLKKDLAETSKTATDVMSSKSKKGHQELYSRLARFTQPESKRRVQIQKIMKDYTNYVGTKMSDRSLQPEHYIYASGMIHNEFFQEVYGALDQPTLKSDEYDMAVLMGDYRSVGFSRFFQDYLKEGIKALGPEKGDSESPDRVETKERLRNSFCIHILSLSELPDDFVSQCKNAVISRGDHTIRFSDFLRNGKPVDFKDRVCAFPNYLNRERYESSLKEGPSSSLKPMPKDDTKDGGTAK